jgi:hypothetical protein
MRQTRRMRGNGETRNSIAGADGETRKRGDPGNREADASEDQRAGATQDLITGSAEGCGIRGDSNLHTASAARGAKIRGDLEIHRWHRRKVREAGKPEQPPASEPRKTKLRGNPGIQPRQEPEDRESGAIRRLIERRHWRAKIRGNPEIRRQGRRRMRDSVATGDPSPAKAGRRVIGATRKPVGKQHWYSEYAGRPGFLKPVLLKDARVEATRSSIAGTA